MGRTTGWGVPFEWTWLVLQWPVVFALVATGIGLVYYFGPDADQDWVWITPGAVVATILWLLVSLLFKLYIANFTDYEASYGSHSPNGAITVSGEHRPSRVCLALAGYKSGLR
jgi:membrane protein